MKDGNNIATAELIDCTGADSPTLHISCFSKEHEGKYSCVVRNQDSTLDSHTVDLRGIMLVIEVHSYYTYIFQAWECNSSTIVSIIEQLMLITSMCDTFFTGKPTLQILRPQYEGIETTFYEDQVTLTVNATGLEPLTYQWMKENETIRDDPNYCGVETNKLFIPSMTRNHEGNYKCKVSNKTGTQISPVIKLKGNTTLSQKIRYLGEGGRGWIN